MVTQILIADDTPASLEATARPLLLAGYEVVRAAGGYEALNLLGQNRPNLALIDVLMPDISGREVLKRIRANATFIDLPVVLLSHQKILTDYPAHGLDDGADGYIVRPVATAELLARVRLHLRQAELTQALRASERRYHEIIARQVDAVLVVDAENGIIQLANPSAEVLFGRRAFDLMGTPFGFPLTNDGPQQIQISRRGHTLTAEMRLGTTQLGGRAVWIITLNDISARVRSSQLENFENGVFESISSGQTLTPILEKIVHGLGEVIDDAAVALFLLDPAGQLVLAASHDLPPRYLAKVSVLPADPEAPYGAAVFKGCAVIGSPKVWSGFFGRTQFPGLKGICCVPVLAPTAAVIGVLALHYRSQRSPDAEMGLLDRATQLIQVACEHHRTEQALLASEKNHRLLFENNPQPCWVYSEKTLQILSANHAAATHYGYTQQEFLGLKVSEIRPKEAPDDQDLVILGETKLSPNQTRLGVARHQTKAKNQMLVEIFAQGLQFEGQAAVQVLALDITERRAVEAQLKASEARFRELLQHIPSIAVQAYTPDGTIVYWNDAATTFYGYDPKEALGKNIMDLTVPAADRVSFAAAMARAVLGEPIPHGETWMLRKDGSRICVLSYRAVLRQPGAPVELFSIDIDLTERKKLEQNSLRAQRMESIGTLAGGIAHDLNNILTPILGSVEFLRDGEDNPEKLEDLATLEACAQRGADVVRQLLLFARGDMGSARKTADVGKIAADVLKMIRETFPRNITISLEQKNHDSVHADVTQMHQVLMNLCVNARDAMPDGGRLNIAVEDIQVDEAYADGNPGSKVGPHVLIRVEDTGPGIPSELQDRIFEPFFTTKPVGKGTGLGLSTCHAIVLSHGGFIRVVSEPDKGTQFWVYLPAVKEAPLTPAIPAPSPLSGKGELILWVDDEEGVRQMATRTLTRRGYQVLTAADGFQAVALYAQNQAHIALVLTDMSMPGMDGLATAAALRKLNPDVKVICSSGYHEKGKLADLRLLGLQGFLPKPYTSDELLRLLRQVLDGS